MKSHVKKLATLLSLLLLLVIAPKQSCGSTNGLSKIRFHSNADDSLLILFHEAKRERFYTSLELGLDTIGIPKRITYMQEDGVFLNEMQEQMTLEKFLWKEQYRQDAVSMYYVNVALEERVNDLVRKNGKLREDLSAAETQALYATSNMEHYKKLYNDSDLANAALRDKNNVLKFKLIVFKTTTVTVSAIALYQGYLLFFKK